MDPRAETGLSPDQMRNPLPQEEGMLQTDPTELLAHTFIDAIRTASLLTQEEQKLKSEIQCKIERCSTDYRSDLEKKSAPFITIDALETLSPHFPKADAELVSRYKVWVGTKCQICHDNMGELAAQSGDSPYTITYDDEQTLTFSLKSFKTLFSAGSKPSQAQKKILQSILVIKPPETRAGSILAYPAFPRWVTRFLTKASQINEATIALAEKQRQEKALAAEEKAKLDKAAEQSRVDLNRATIKNRFLSRFQEPKRKTTAPAEATTPIPAVTSSSSPTSEGLFPPSQSTQPGMAVVPSDEPKIADTPRNRESDKKTTIRSSKEAQPPDPTLKQPDSRVNPHATRQYSVGSNGRLQGRMVIPIAHKPTFDQMPAFSRAQYQPSPQMERQKAKPLTRDANLDRIIFALLDEKSAHPICKAIGDIETYRLAISNDGPSTTDRVKDNEYNIAKNEMKSLRQTLKLQLGSLNPQNGDHKAIAEGWIKDYFKAIQQLTSAKTLPAPPSSSLKNIFIIASFMLVGFALGFGVGWCLVAGATLKTGLVYGGVGAGVGLLASYCGVALFSPRLSASIQIERSKRLVDIHNEAKGALPKVSSIPG